jgi:hypothetical protein
MMPVDDAIDLQLQRLIQTLEPHVADPALDRAYLEALWLRDERAAGRLTLPLDRADDIYLAWALAEGLFDDLPEAKEAAEDVAAALIG